MFTLLLVSITFVAGIMAEKYVSDVFEFGRTETFIEYLKAATIEFAKDLVAIIRAAWSRE